jgi:hypothetical protein
MKLRITSVKCSLNAEGWQLYTASAETHAQLAELAGAAFEINRAVEDAVATSIDAVEAINKVLPVLAKHSRLGADDTEPRAILCELIQSVLPVEG